MRLRMRMRMAIEVHRSCCRGLFVFTATVYSRTRFVCLINRSCNNNNRARSPPPFEVRSRSDLSGHEISFSLRADLGTDLGTRFGFGFGLGLNRLVRAIALQWRKWRIRDCSSIVLALGPHTWPLSRPFAMAIIIIIKIIIQSQAKEKIHNTGQGSTGMLILSLSRRRRRVWAAPARD